VRKLDLGAGGPSVPLELRHTALVRALAEVGGPERPEGFGFLSGGDDGKVLAQRWNGDFEVLEALPRTRVLALAAAPGGERAAWSFDDGTVVLYSLKFEKEIARQRGPLTRTLAFSADGAQLALGRDDKRVAVLKAETGAVLVESEAFDAEVSAVAWLGPALVAVGRGDGALSDWDTASGARLHQWTGPGSRITALAVSGNRLAAGTHDGQGWVWNAERSGPPDYRVPADAGDVRAVGFAQEALVLVGSDRRVHVLGK
jgi:WD40 repeat protein